MNRRGACRIRVTEPWYGPGYCDVCGGEPEPKPCIHWDPDDGWILGVLCPGCFEAAFDRGPAADDYANQGQGEEDQLDRFVGIVETCRLCDLDAAWSDFGRRT